MVARRSGLEYEAYVQQRLIEPLALGRTSFERIEPAADGYLVEPYSDRVRPEENVIKGAFAAAGSLWSTPRDLCRWARFLVEGEEGVLAKETAEEMRRFQSMADLDEWKLGWGLGLMLIRERDRIFVGHGGAMPGFLAGLAISPKERAGAAVLVNSGAGVKVEKLLRELAVKAAEAYPPEPEPWQPVEEVPPELAPLLGVWWTEGNQVVIRYRDGRLELRYADAAPSLPPSVFETEGDGRFRGVSGPEEGERLEVVRRDDGGVEKLNWIRSAFRLRRTRAQYSFCRSAYAATCGSSVAKPNAGGLGRSWPLRSRV